MEYRAIYNDEYISHYGVMGMRWGHRKDGGPQGYLGTYSKGGKNWTTKRTTELPKNYDKKKRNALKNNTKVIDDFLKKNHIYSYTEFKSRGGYSVYESVGITEKMLNVNLTKRGFQATSIGNCGSCSLAAVINKKGGNVMASPSLDGMNLFTQANIMGSLGGKTVWMNDLVRQALDMSTDKRHDYMNWVNMNMPNNTIGIISYAGMPYGHAFYVQKDKDGNIVTFNPQNPTMQTTDWTKLGPEISSFGDTRSFAMSISYVDADGEFSKEAIDELIKKGYVIPYNEDLLPTEAKPKPKLSMKQFSSMISDSVNLINVAKNFPGPVSVGATLVTSIMKDQMEKLDTLNTIAKDAVKRLQSSS